MFILSILGALIVGGLLSLILTYFLPKEKIRSANQVLEQQEQATQLRIKDLEKEYVQKNAELNKKYSEHILDLENKNKTLEETANKKISELKQIQNEAENNYKLKLNEFESQKSLILKEIEEKKNQIQEIQNNAEIIEIQAIDNATIEAEQKIKELYQRYEKLESELLVHYTDLADQQMDVYIAYQEKLDNEILSKQNELNNLKSKATAAAEANKRLELDRQQRDFYRLQLQPVDLEEISKIRSIEPYLRKKEPLNKVIWKVYYEKPCTDLIGRVIGPLRKTGIYKITNINNGMCYVGQATDIAERFKQHIKRGLGADPPTQNKLYPAMLTIGVENFTFEVIEECAAIQLNEREDYWQEFYHAKDFGYSIK